jgi:hypothetical protein
VLISLQPPQKKRVIAHAVVAAMVACSGGGGGAPTPAPPSVNNPPDLSIDAAQTVLEGQSRIAKIDASDPDGDSISLDLSGEDANLFTVSSDNYLEFISPPRYSLPNDSDLDRIYRVVVTASDGQLEAQTEIEITVQPDRLILSGRLLPSGPVISALGNDNQAQVHLDCNWDNDLDQFEPLVIADASGNYSFTAQDTFESEEWFPCDTFWINAGTTSEARPYIELLPWRLRIFGGVMANTGLPNSKIFKATVESPAASALTSGGEAKTGNNEPGSTDLSATHFEVELVADELFLAVWDGAIDLSVNTGANNKPIVSFGEDEEFDFQVLTDSGELTSPSNSPEEFAANLAGDIDEAGEQVSQGLGLGVDCDPDDNGDGCEDPVTYVRSNDTWDLSSSSEAAADIQRVNAAINVVLSAVETLHSDLEGPIRSDLASHALKRSLEEKLSNGEVLDVANADDITDLLKSSYEERSEGDLPAPDRQLSDEELSSVGSAVEVITNVMTDSLRRSYR